MAYLCVISQARLFCCLALQVLWCPPMCVGCGIRLMPAKHFGITQSSVGVKTALFKIENLLLSTHLTNWYSWLHLQIVSPETMGMLISVRGKAQTGLL